MAAEEQIAQEKYQKAIDIYSQLFKEYTFVFLKEYQAASQLALYLDDHQRACLWLKKGITAGWSLGSIKKNKFIRKNLDKRSFDSVLILYDSLRAVYLKNLDLPLQNQIHIMFRKDQKKAIFYLFKWSSKSKKRYAENNFASHSRKQIEEITRVLQNQGYAGEKTIGNNVWMSTILAHHNSISEEIVAKDKLYKKIKPLLFSALYRGELSPYEFALIDAWYCSTLEQTAYGILNSPEMKELESINLNRAKVLLRSVQLRNKLVNIEQLTGIDFYLPGNPWIKGKIEIKS